MKRFNFPGGEVHVVLEHNHFPCVWNLWSSDDIMAFLLAADAYPLYSAKDLRITIPYIPYARQDRITQQGEPLSARVMAKLINMVKAKEIVVWDPHSDVVPALINNCTVIQQYELIKGSVIESKPYAGVIAPDMGAVKKAHKVAQQLRVPLFVAHKFRNTSTGEITDVAIVDPTGTMESTGGHFLISDDICDGGRTFIELAKVLPKKCTADLYVTHGIFSRGVEPLLECYRRVFTANKHPHVVCDDPNFIEIFT